MSKQKELRFMDVQKQLKLIEKLQWRPKIQTWEQIKETTFFKINKQLQTNN